jgi:hypothetical protein
MPDFKVQAKLKKDSVKSVRILLIRRGRKKRAYRVLVLV